MLVEVADRKCLHAVEHVIPHVLQRALRYRRHDLRKDVGGNDARSVHGDHGSDNGEQLRIDCLQSFRHAGSDGGVNEGLKEDRRDDARKPGDGEADQDDHKAPFVKMKHIFHHPAEGAGLYRRTPRGLFFAGTDLVCAAWIRGQRFSLCLSRCRCLNGCLILCCCHFTHSSLPDSEHLSALLSHPAVYCGSGSRRPPGRCHALQAAPHACPARRCGRRP